MKVNNVEFIPDSESFCPLVKFSHNEPFLQFHKEGELVGTLDLIDGKWNFVGKAEESAEIFFEAIKDTLTYWMNNRKETK